MARPELHLPPGLVDWLAPFLAAFSRRTRPTVAALAVGALLSVGPRTVAACLRVLGLAEHPGLPRYLASAGRAGVSRRAPPGRGVRLLRRARGRRRAGRVPLRQLSRSASPSFWTVSWTRAVMRGSSSGAAQGAGAPSIQTVRYSAD